MVTARNRMSPDVARVFSDFPTFAKTFLYILDTNKHRTRLRLNKAQLHFHAHKQKRNLLLKARQFGFSTYEQGDIYYNSVTRTTTSLTLAHEDDTTQKLRRIADRFHENMPEGFRPNRKYANARVTTYSDFDSEVVIATAGNRNTGRGGTYSRLHGSEVAFWPDAESIIAGALQGGDPLVVFETTPNGAQGYFYDTWMRAWERRQKPKGPNDWHCHFYPWWWDEYKYCMPLLEGEELRYTGEEEALIEKFGLRPDQIKWRRSKLEELKGLFPQEYPEDPLECFLLSGLGFFGNILSYSRDVNFQYSSDHTYFAGLDWGRNPDFTVLSVFNKNTKKQVAILRINNMSYEQMRRRVVLFCKQWHIKGLIAEENSMGEANVEALKTALADANVATDVMPFRMTNDSKRQIMGELYDGFDTGGLQLLPVSEQKREMQAYTMKQNDNGTWIFAPANKETGHDDIVIANALGYHGVLHGARRKRSGVI